MNLTDCRFTHAGQDVRFTVYSDSAVATKLVDVLDMPVIGQAEVYRIEPEKAQYVAVIENEQGVERSRYWQRIDGQFVEVIRPVMIARIRGKLKAKLAA